MASYPAGAALLHGACAGSAEGLLEYMTRIGINPARRKISNYKPARVTVAILTHIPYIEGYFEQRLQILKLVISSLLTHTSLPYDLLVFDNGSCPEVVDFLQEQKEVGDIDYLLLSRENIGKIGAFRILFSAAPGELVAYSDDDILYYPNWLQAHLEILDNFPDAGMVSGVPVRNASQHATDSLTKFVENQSDEITSTYKRAIPDDWEMDWAISTGRNPEEVINQFKDTQDLVLTKNGSDGYDSISAIGSANHFQFVTSRDLILKALPSKWSGKLMGSMTELDEAVDDMGFLRLSTTERYTRHLGNTLTPEKIEEVQSLGIPFRPEQIKNQQVRFHKKRFLFRIPGSRKLLSGIYNYIYYLLYR